MANLFGFIYFIAENLLKLLEFAIIASAVMSWLIAFNVLNDRHAFVRQIERFLWAVTRPVLRPLQRVIPPLGTVDVTPIIALLVIEGFRLYLLRPMFVWLTLHVG